MGAVEVSGKSVLKTDVGVAEPTSLNKRLKLYDDQSTLNNVCTVLRTIKLYFWLVIKMVTAPMYKYSRCVHISQHKYNIFYLLCYFVLYIVEYPFFDIVCQQTYTLILIW